MVADGRWQMGKMLVIVSPSVLAQSAKTEEQLHILGMHNWMLVKKGGFTGNFSWC